MSLTASALFSTDPAKIKTFGGTPTADIFNQTVVERNNALQRMAEQSFAELDEFSERRAQLSAEREQENLLAVSTVDDFLSSVRQKERGFGEIDDFGDVDYNDPMDLSGVPDIPQRSRGGTVGDAADIVFQNEARRDKRGRLSVYSPPEGDGGGSFEVAGITARYQPREAARLRQLVSEGRHDEAEEAAKDFYRRRAEPFVKHSQNPGVQLQLTDTVHHRGEGGLRSILRIATGTSDLSSAEMIAMIDRDPDGLRKFHEARRNYERRVVDRGRESRAKFRQGLENRFQKVYDLSLQLNQ
jgi:hypothetical protein